MQKYVTVLLLVGVDCVADKSKLEWKLHFLEWKTGSFALSLILRMLVIIFWGSISKYSGEASPQIPLEKREKRLLVDTVGYSIQTCWLLQFHWNPCKTVISVEWYGCNWSYLWTSFFKFSEVRLYLMILEKLELYDKALDVLRKSNLAGKHYWLTNNKSTITHQGGWLKSGFPKCLATLI